MTDPIADMLSRINNALKVKADSLDIPHSKMKEGLAGVLAAEGYISAFEILNRMNKKIVRVSLKYTGPRKQSVIRGLKRVSTPGTRVYAGRKELPRVQSGYGTAIITTSKGLMTDEEARAKKIGGEVIALIW